MTKPAGIMQAKLRRYIKVARELGVRVRMWPDGTLTFEALSDREISPAGRSDPQGVEKSLAEEEEIVL
jgi:hypothetical protein